MPDNANDKSPDQYDEKNSASIRRFLADYETKKDENEDEDKGEEDVPEDKADDKEAIKADEAEKAKAELLKKEEIDKTVNEAKKEVLDKIKASFGLTEDEEKELKEEGLTPPWEKEKRNPKSYREIVEFSAELAEFKRKKEEELRAKQQSEADNARKQSEKQLNEMWDEQLADLREQKKLPDIAPEIKAKLQEGKPLTKEEAKDPGLEAQRQLFAKMYELAEARKSAGKSVSTNLKEVYYEHYQQKSQPAGANAPVSGGTGTAPEDDDRFTYKDIHGASFYDLVNS
jgi:hypothetical protein